MTRQDAINIINQHNCIDLQVIQEVYDFRKEKIMQELSTLEEWRQAEEQKAMKEYRDAIARICTK